uniref:OSJNBb0068N06.24 protein n=1 Tax=Oryza sativa subsp. japonica TaxID=39947 RepID=Q7F9Q6_ORYSJ|nr:OSJNBb0068N06.24 [Oryza sativa Japonica Group]
MVDLAGRMADATAHGHGECGGVDGEARRGDRCSGAGVMEGTGESGGKRKRVEESAGKLYWGSEVADVAGVLPISPATWERSSGVARRWRGSAAAALRGGSEARPSGVARRRSSGVGVIGSAGATSSAVAAASRSGSASAGGGVGVSRIDVGGGGLEKERERDRGREREGGVGGSHPRDAAEAEATTTTPPRRRRDTTAASAQGCPRQWRQRRSRDQGKNF